MGLIKAITGAAGGALADQWKEFFYCEAIDKEILAVKGEKRTGGRQLDGVYRLDHAVTATQKTILKAFGLNAEDVRYRAGYISEELKK